MTVDLAGGGIDAGVVTENPEVLSFYRDVLGLEEVDVIPFPGLGDVHKLRCGESHVKVLQLGEPAAARHAGGGIGGSTGIRYLTLYVKNVEEIIEACRAAGAVIALDAIELPGRTVAMVEDPDANTLELLQYDS